MPKTVAQLMPVAADADWNMFKQACAWANPSTNAESGTPEGLRDKINTLSELLRLSRTQCIECWGYGHPPDGCTTR